MAAPSGSGASATRPSVRAPGARGARQERDLGVARDVDHHQLGAGAERHDRRRDIEVGARGEVGPRRPGAALEIAGGRVVDRRRLAVDERRRRVGAARRDGRGPGAVARVRRGAHGLRRAPGPGEREVPVREGAVLVDEVRGGAARGVEERLLARDGARGDARRHRPRAAAPHGGAHDVARGGGVGAHAPTRAIHGQRGAEAGGARQRRGLPRGARVKLAPEQARRRAREEEHRRRGGATAARAARRGRGVACAGRRGAARGRGGGGGRGPRAPGARARGAPGAG